MRRFTALLAAMGLALSATAPCVRAADAPSSTQVEQMRASVKANDRDGVFACRALLSDRVRNPRGRSCFAPSAGRTQLADDRENHVAASGQAPIALCGYRERARRRASPDRQDEGRPAEGRKAAIRKPARKLPSRARCPRSGEPSWSNKFRARQGNQGLSQMHALAAAHAHPTQHAAVSPSDWNAIHARYAALGGSPAWLKATTTGKSVAALPVEVRCASRHRVLRGRRRRV